MRNGRTLHLPLSLALHSKSSFIALATCFYELIIFFKLSAFELGVAATPASSEVLPLSANGKSDSFQLLGGAEATILTTVPSLYRKTGRYI